jgi:hypothetical protein
MSAILLLLALLAGPALGQTVINGDAWVSGQMGVGTTAPSAQLQINASSAATTIFQVSDIIGTPIMSLSNTGNLSFQVTPAASMDVIGAGDNSAIGLQLGNGNLYPNTSSIQAAFGYNGTGNLSHAIRTVHSTSTAGNSMDFLLWNTGVSTTAIGNLEVLTLVTISSSASSTEASFHVMPIGVSTVEVTVSNGSTLGGGTVERAAEITHSSKELKSDIAYLGPEDEQRAYDEVFSLKPASFRYMVWNKKKKKLVRDRHQQIRRGLIYEDSPDDIKGPGKSLVLDERVTNMELATKELLRRLDALDADAAKQEQAP